MSIWRAGDTAGLATVVGTCRSAPRPPGASMLLAPDGSVTGSVSGGCVEGAVYDVATEVAKTGTPRLERYGVSDDDAFAVGLTCGGVIDVFVESISRATFSELDTVADDRVTVCDARAVCAAPVGFPTADQVVVDWPHRYLAAQAAAGAVDENTVICVLTHDPKFDVPVLEVALRLGVGYVGAMGSRRTHDDRMNRLRAAGLTDAELSRLASPIGLDLGARTPEETAVSIAADIIARRWRGAGRPLTETAGRIHHDAGEPTLWP